MADRKALQSGFSLVEMAMVLLVIGLIVGGVLKGQDLIESARMNSIQVQANELRTATRTFYKKYQGWPGDISDADAARIGPSLGGLSVGAAGLGDGMVDGDRLNGTTASEPTWFWHHLRGAGLISGIPVVANGTLTGTQALTSRMGGVWTFDWISLNVLPAFPTFGVPDVDHWFALGTTAAAPNLGPMLTPRQLRALDLKSDDGMPNTGNVAGGNTTNPSCRSGPNATDPYASESGVTCFAWFRL